MASRYWRTPDWATPSAMILSTFRGSVASVLSARAMAPVSGCERYCTPAGDRYCTPWAWAVVAARDAATTAERIVILENLRLHLGTPSPPPGRNSGDRPSPRRHPRTSALGLA